MRRILSLTGLAVAAWVSCLAFEGILSVMAATRAWHPHFLPVTPVLAFVLVAGLALLIGSTWRVVRGPVRRRALKWLLIGMAPLWLVAGHFLYGFAAGSGRNHAPDPLMRSLAPLGDAVRDIEARFRYPQRTSGEKVVMLSAAMPEAQAQAEMAAMDRHIRALEARLGQPAGWAVQWARGPILGRQGITHKGLSVGSRPGEARPDAGGLTPMDLHEVAHGMINSLCTMSSDPPAVLVEGWAEANMGCDPVEQARGLKDDWERGNGYTLRQLTDANWYHRHQGPAYVYGAPLVGFLLRRFGPETFLQLYTTCNPATFDEDCRCLLGLDIDGLDAALRADVDQFLAGAGSLDRHRLERLRLDPRVATAEWKAFLENYLTAAERMLAPKRHARVTVVATRSDTDAQGRTESSSTKERSLRSGRFASLWYQSPHFELAYLAHPCQSIEARRAAAERTWHVEGKSKRTPEQGRQHALHLIDILDTAGVYSAPLLALARLPLVELHEDLVVTAFDRFSEGDRPRVRIRIEDRSPADKPVPWRVMTFVLAADDLYAARTVRSDGGGTVGTRIESEYVYDRHEGIPVVRLIRTTTNASDGSRGTIDVKVVERRFGPIPEGEFDPDRFLDGPKEIETRPDSFADQPPTLGRWVWLPFAVGMLCLAGGAAIPIGSASFGKGKPNQALQRTPAAGLLPRE